MNPKKEEKENEELVEGHCCPRCCPKKRKPWTKEEYEAYVQFMRNR